MKFKVLDREASVSLRGRKRTIEEIRQTVAQRDRNFKISKYEDKYRVAIYRNGIKVAVVEIEEEGITEDEILNNIKEEILKGTFDEQLTKVYRQVLEERKKKREKKEET